jgi:hypothetical protein
LIVEKGKISLDINRNCIYDEKEWKVLGWKAGRMEGWAEVFPPIFHSRGSQCL